MSLTVDDFDFPLPPELIAQHPAAERSGSRMLHVCGRQLFDRQFADLPTLLAAGDLLVFNDTRVVKARIFGEKASGGTLEERVKGPGVGVGRPSWGGRLPAGMAPGQSITVARRCRRPSCTATLASPAKVPPALRTSMRSSSWSASKALAVGAQLVDDAGIFTVSLAQRRPA